MNLVATRWWSMLFMPSCVLMAGIAVGLAWCLWSWRRGKSPRQAWPAVALAAGSAFLLYLASTPLVARWAAPAKVDAAAKQWMGRVGVKRGGA